VSGFVGWFIRWYHDLPQLRCTEKKSPEICGIGEVDLEKSAWASAPPA
jgi:hypothetical protein